MPRKIKILLTSLVFRAIPLILASKMPGLPVHLPWKNQTIVILIRKQGACFGTESKSHI